VGGIVPVKKLPSKFKCSSWYQILTRRIEICETMKIFLQLTSMIGINLNIPRYCMLKSSGGRKPSKPA